MLIRGLQRDRSERRRRSVGALPPLLGWLLALAASAATAAVDPASLAEFERLAEAGRYEELVARLEPVVEAVPESAEPRFLLGNAYVGLGRYDDAVDVYVALTRDFPGRPEPHNNLAVIFVEQGRLEEARTALLAAARLRPGYARAHENLGDLYMLMAESAYARAEAIRTEDRPETEEAGAALRDRRQPSPVSALAERRAVLAAVERWRDAWNREDVDAYFDCYLPDYRPDPETAHDGWRRRQRARLTHPDRIELELRDLRVVDASGDTATVTFEQHDRAGDGSEVTARRLQLERRDGRWLIAAESPG